ncbi:MAG: hypothetical protein KAT61_03585, partial [Gammaproteobacteria bacterium]|nr:hypothetical protein [Gammaproteobacteria bacterium]
VSMSQGTSESVMNRHLAIKMSCFCVLELRNSPAITPIPRPKSEHFNHNLFDPDLIRDSLSKKSSEKNIISGVFIYVRH